MANLLIRLTSTPYGTSDAADGLDFAIGATNYGHHVTLLFEGNGLWQLIHQSPPDKGVKNHSKRLKSLTFFDIDACYYSEQDRLSLGITQDKLSPVVSKAEQGDITSLINNSDHVVTF
ncbi:DsrE family protein [Alteromonas sp. C1M14]|uniref:DsrE family protein n=1 Tax=Alteromonas sp. C1M14 TaxID=2841567 RepID=UPI001C08B19C|nr:DsrE family protein [Alteromonas sp. C1M14]MBU2976827.1 DsrE family protein [Alteromonas sp. C1M14]